MTSVVLGRSAGLCLLLLSACGEAPSPSVAGHLDKPHAVAILKNAHCGACHDLGETHRDDLRGAEQPSLELLGSMVDLAANTPKLRHHYAGEQEADVRAWLRSLAATDAGKREPTELPAGWVAFGGRLVDELGCRACHTPPELNLGAMATHAQVAGFLREPTSLLPELAHVPLADGEASAVAAWLLRSQLQESAPNPGFNYECFEMQIEDGEQPDFTGLQPSVRGVVTSIDIEPRTRDQHYALRFQATLRIPTSGEWTFVTGSDDGSWLWIDGELVVDNGALKPHGQESGKRQLAAGPHELQVVHTQAAGGHSLEVLWQGPGVERAPVPGSAASAAVARLLPPERAEPVLDAAQIARGRAAARAARCNGCHSVSESEYLALPKPAAAKPWNALGEGECVTPVGPTVHREVGELPAGRLDAATRLGLQLVADRCLSCHVRAGNGGIRPAVQAKLVHVEDMGDEGILPPDLTDVGKRLRSEWIERVIRDGHKARDYVRMRMPAYGAAKAKMYAALFAEVDGAGVVDAAPSFDGELAEKGRRLVGVGGRNCINCHRVQGHASLGIQGMDLAQQFTRLRPAWLHDWLLRPTELRPNTRMPRLWLRGDEQDEAEIAAILAWMSLGESAPIPPGVVVDASSMHLVPADRPVLHGAFLRGVSARCLAVGTPQRTHFAYDLAEPRLVWLWRGAFVDGSKTWSGRAGKLVTPLGADWIKLKDFTVSDGAARRMLGQRRTEDGYPVLRVAVGDGTTRYEDVCRPRLRQGGSEVVRSIRCTDGSLALRLEANDGVLVKVAGAVVGPAGMEQELAAGQSLEVVYQW